MRVEILFYGFVRDIVDSSRLALDTPEGLTVRNLIELLIKRVGESPSADEWWDYWTGLTLPTRPESARDADGNILGGA